jgi:hypothetical protein
MALAMVKPKEQEPATETKSFFAGVPTDIEIRRLRDAYPDESLVAGETIPYADIANIIAAPYRSHRFCAVTDRWRRIIEHETGKIIGTVPGEAFKILHENEKVDLANDKLRYSQRATRRSLVVASMVNVKSLTEQERKEYDHAVNHARMLIGVVKSRVALPTI